MRVAFAALDRVSKRPRVPSRLYTIQYTFQGKIAQNLVFTRVLAIGTKTAPSVRRFHITGKKADFQGWSAAGAIMNYGPVCSVALLGRPCVVSSELCPIAPHAAPSIQWLSLLSRSRLLPSRRGIVRESAPSQRCIETIPPDVCPLPLALGRAICATE